MKTVKYLGIIGILALLLIPTSLAVALPQEQEEQPTDLGWTFLRGFITKPSLTNAGQDVQFRAILVHYRTHIFGVSQRGVLRGFQKIVLPNDYTGILGNHYVFARFDGRMTFL
ncbi:MAG: hypothetical protein JXA00_02690 [Candidatus Thermoplasmatota archaeon]|nr:hypothetical protein [Candidatus Thermoplasmatota archaeon]